MIELLGRTLWRTFSTCRARTHAGTVNEMPCVARSGDAARMSACATIVKTQ
jgi:hypothetical protein